MPTGLLDFERTVPRRLVHRRAVPEVFICGSAALGPDEFAVATQLPRAHLLWSDRPDGYHDSLMAAEAGRQAMIMLGHAHYGVGRDVMMIARSSEVVIRDRAAFADDGATPLEGAFVLRLADRSELGGVPVSLTFEGNLFLAGIPALTMIGTLVYTPDADYRLLRAHSRARKGLGLQPAAAPPAAPVVPVAPARVGRRLPGNVVIGTGAGPCDHVLLVDQANPCFFDHPLDHVPGQLLLEACRQSAIVTAVRDSLLPGPACMVTACQVSFSDFVELDAVAGCSTRVLPPNAGGAVRVAVGVRQLGADVGTVELELAALPGSEPDQAGDDRR